MTEQAIPRQPLTMAVEGVKVQLVFRDNEGKTWRSPHAFYLRNGKWWSARSGLPLTGPATPIGWNKWEDERAVRMPVAPIPGANMSRTSASAPGIDALDQHHTTETETSNG